MQNCAFILVDKQSRAERSAIGLGLFAVVLFAPKENKRCVRLSHFDC